MGKIEIISVVIDTNVFISAFLFGGVPGSLITIWKTGKIRPLISDSIIDEYLRVLAYPKFKLTEEDINYILYHETLPWFDIVTISKKTQIVSKDPDDDKFLHCADKGNAGYIISGDQHLLSLKFYKKIPIVSPSQFLAELGLGQPVEL